MIFQIRKGNKWNEGEKSNALKAKSSKMEEIKKLDKERKSKTRCKKLIHINTSLIKVIISQIKEQLKATQLCAGDIPQQWGPHGFMKT
jgi:hypothetical protein